MSSKLNHKKRSHRNHGNFMFQSKDKTNHEMTGLMKDIPVMKHSKRKLIPWAEDRGFKFDENGKLIEGGSNAS